MGINNSKTKITGIKKFLLLFGIVVAYAVFSIYSYGVGQGISVTLLTWSFFVFCTPIADAGFLVDLPVRLVAGLRMLYSEMIVWLLATIINAYFLITNPEIYQKTALLSLFHKILTNPWPLGLIIVLSAIGSFVSVVFDDGVYDVAADKIKHKNIVRSKTKMIWMIGVYVVTICLYILLLRSTHTHLDIF